MKYTCKYCGKLVEFGDREHIESCLEHNSPEGIYYHGKKSVPAA